MGRHAKGIRAYAGHTIARGAQQKSSACIVSATKKVAQELRNTVAVCRKSYINPLIFTAWQTGILHQYVQEQAKCIQEELEIRILTFLRRQHSR